MIQICCTCGVQFGEKPPLDDQSETHGYCKSCYDKELEKLHRLKTARLENRLKSLLRKEFVDG